MPLSLPRWLALAAVALVALALRTSQLDTRPMHADEANQAVKTGLLLEGAGYTFDPRDHHGPTLYYLALPIAWARGEHSLAALSETSLRLVPALLGTLAVAALAGLGGTCVARAGAAPAPAPGARPAGPTALGVLAALFLALSPPAVYYARDFIQETLLLAFTLFAVLGIRQWWVTGRLAFLAGGGASVGLMLATKETAVVLLGAVALAAVCLRPTRPASTRIRRDVAVALAAAIAVAALFYTGFGRSPGALRDALVAPFLGLARASGGSGHEKPWTYYLQLLTWQRTGGLVWHQAAFTALAGVGLVAAIGLRWRWVLGVAVYGGLVLIAFSAVPYKTPWNIIHVIPPLAVLAAAGLVGLTRLRTGWLVAVPFALLTCATLATQTRRVAFQRPADQRNPYAYVHSSADVKKYRPLVAAALAAHPQEPVRIISEEYWPLPWYLRGLPRIGYWATPPEDCDGALVIASADQASAVRQRLHGPYRESFLGLRPGFVCIVFTPAAP